MKTFLTSLFAISLFAFSSCSKQEIEDGNQAALVDILEGNWQVASVKYTQQIGLSSVTHTSTQANGAFTFTSDSTYHSVGFTYSLEAGGQVVNVPDQVSQNGYYSFVEKDEDEIQVVDQQSGSIVTYQTRLRTASSMTLDYEFKDTDIITGIKTVNRYTFTLAKG